MLNVTQKTVNDWLAKRKNRPLTDDEWTVFLDVLQNSMWDDDYGFIEQVVDEIRMTRATPAERVHPVILLTEPALRYCADIIGGKPLTAIEVDQLRDYCEMEPHFWEIIEEVVTQLRKDAASERDVQLDVRGEASAHS
jgi:hypothetical protein